MAVPMTYNGNDDNALEALVSENGLAFSHAGNTHHAIDALADLTSVVLGFGGNDRNMMEAWAAAFVASIPCAYPFNVDEAGILAAGFAGRLTHSVDNKTVSINGTSIGAGAPRYAAVISSDFDMTEASRTMEIDYAFTGTGSTGPYFLGVYFYRQPTLDYLDRITRLYIGHQESGDVEITDHDGFVNSGLIPASGTLSIEFNPIAGTAAVSVAGVSIGTITDLSMATFRAVSAVLENSNYIEGVNMNQSLTFRTDAATFTQAYAPGKMDMCGNEIGV